MSKSAPSKTEDDIAEAVIAAAEAEAENEEAQASASSSQAAATAVAAAQGAVAIANEESAKAQQRAASEVQRNQEENLWLRETMCNLHKNSETQATMLTETRQELNNLKTGIAGLMEKLTPPKSMPKEPDTSQVTPQKETLKSEAENRAGEKQAQMEAKKKQARRWI